MFWGFGRFFGLRGEEDLDRTARAQWKATRVGKFEDSLRLLSSFRHVVCQLTVAKRISQQEKSLEVGQYPAI
jgi:hypothetical protein